MSNSSEFLVGALGMKARNPGESIETTEGASCSSKKRRILAGSFPSGVMSPSRACSGTATRLPKSSGTGSIARRSRQ